MKPLKRINAPKRGSTRKFNKAAKRTNPNNMRTPMRGGWRL